MARNCKIPEAGALFRGKIGNAYGVVALLFLAATAAYLVLFFFYPLTSILSRSLGGSGGGLTAFATLVRDPYYLELIWFTLWQSTASTVLTLIVGLPIAYLFARHDFHGKTFLRAMTTVPFVMPTIVVAVGFVALLGHQGLLNTTLVALFNLDSPPIKITNTLSIIFVAHAFYNYSIVVRIVSAFWANIDQHLWESAQMLGSGRILTFIHVTLPILSPAIMSAALLAFTFSFTSFGVLLILGGPQFATMEVAIYELAAKLFRLELAAALAIVQMTFTYIFFLVHSRLQERASVPIKLVPHKAAEKVASTSSENFLTITIILAILVLLSPLLALAERAFSSAEGYSLTHFLSLFSNQQGSHFYLAPLSIAWNSLLFAVITMTISLFLGTSIAYFLSRPGRNVESFSDAFLMLPLGVSAVIMGFGFLLAFNKGFLDLRGSWTILVIAHSLIAYPFVMRSLLPVLRGIPTQLREAAYVLGASHAKTFVFVDLPLIARCLLVGATFAFAVSMGEFGASLLLARPEFTTLPVAIFRLLSLPGDSNLGQALAMSSILMVVVALGFIAIERLRYRDMGSF